MLRSNWSKGIPTTNDGRRKLVECLLVVVREILDQTLHDAVNHSSGGIEPLHLIHREKYTYPVNDAALAQLYSIKTENPIAQASKQQFINAIQKIDNVPNNVEYVARCMRCSIRLQEYLLLPCHHFVWCSNCILKELKFVKNMFKEHLRCSLCKANVLGIKRIYLALNTIDDVDAEKNLRTMIDHDYRIPQEQEAVNMNGENNEELMNYVAELEEENTNSIITRSRAITLMGIIGRILPVPERYSYNQKCIICRRQISEYMFAPCNHFNYCKNCVVQLLLSIGQEDILCCRLCRAAVIGIHKIYLKAVRKEEAEIDAEEEEEEEAYGEEEEGIHTRAEEIVAREEEINAGDEIDDRDEMPFI